MVQLSKKQKNINKIHVPGKVYKAPEAIQILKKFASTKFKEGVDIAINLGIDSRKSDQVVRSSTKLPKGTGKEVRVAVFAQGENATKAINAGADKVGFEDLAEEIKNGYMDFDVVIATPDAMRLVGQLGQVLGPRGLMPNPKVGTVTMQVENAVHDAKSGQVRYRTDKNGIVHCTVGKIEFSEEDIMANISALMVDLKKLKPVSSKGVYFKKICLTTTMGPGLLLDIASIAV